MAGDGCGEWVACEIAACVRTDCVSRFEWGSMAEDDGRDKEKGGKRWVWRVWVMVALVAIK